MRSHLRRMFCLVAPVCAGVMLLTSATLASPSGTDAKTASNRPVKASGNGTRTISIMGAAWKADNSPIPNAKLRLRNVVTGKIEATAVANETGQFIFTDLESGSYIVELVSDSGKILTIGHTITVGPGETVATFVRTGTKVPWFNGFFGNAASSVSSAAASTGVTAVAPEAMQCASPPCGIK